jgi:hypothetical protein
MPSTFLSRAETAELCGTPRRARQIEVLQKNGVRHVINASGWPVVPRSAIDSSVPQTKEPQGWSPAVLRRAG